MTARTSPSRPYQPRSFTDEQLARARSVDLAHLAAQLGLNVNTRSTAGVTCTCPNHAAHKANDAHLSLRIHTKNNRAPHAHYHCYVCSWHGDAIELVTEVTGMAFPQAVRYLTGEADPDVQVRRAALPQQAPAAPAQTRDWSRLTRRAAQLLHTSPDATAYLESRGLSSVAQRFGLGYNPPFNDRAGNPSLYGHRLVIPHVMPDGSVPFAKYRALGSVPDGVPKYMSTSGVALEPYLWSRSIAEARVRGYLFVVEGELDALSLKAALSHDPELPVIGLPGVHGLKEELDVQFIGLRVILVMDADKAGHTARAAYHARLGRLNCVLEDREPIVAEDGTDLNDMLRLLGPDVMGAWVQDVIDSPMPTRRRTVL